jgi:hypothetical protein
MQENVGSGIACRHARIGITISGDRSSKRRQYKADGKATGSQNKISLVAGKITQPKRTPPDEMDRRPREN